MAGATAAIAANAAAGIGKGLTSSPPNTSVFNDRSVINIAPGETNLGEMLRVATGAPNNGGFGGRNSSRYMQPGRDVRSRVTPTSASAGTLGAPNVRSSEGFPFGTMAMVVGALTVGVVLFRGIG